MSFFKGSELYSVDAKGRISLPAKMRKNLAPEANDTFVVTRGPDDEPCIYAYPLDEWRKFEESLKALNQFQERDRFFVRTLLLWADEITLDNQARISIPKGLVDFTGIDKTALIIGAIDHVEIWKPETFDNYLNGRTESYANVAQSVMGLRGA